MASDRIKHMTLWAAVSLGIGAMVGAGIFSLMGEATSMAGGLTPVAFALGGIVALLAGYSYGKLGARFPSAGGVVEYLVQAYGPGILSGGLSVFYYSSLVIGTAMVARAFGAYGSQFLGEGAHRVAEPVFAAAAVVALTMVNLIGAAAVAPLEKAFVASKLTALGAFAIAGIVTVQPSLIVEAGSPGAWPVLSAVGITFFAYTGFGIITNAAEDMPDPHRTLPRAIFVAIGIVIVLYVVLATVVLGNLPLAEIVAGQDTVLALAAQPVFGAAGFTIMAVAAVLSTSSTINASLYGALNISYLLAKYGQLPRPFQRRVWKGGTEGLVLTAGLMIVLAVGMQLATIAAAAGAAALLLYLAVQWGHLDLVGETGADRRILWFGVAATGLVAGIFVVYSWTVEPLRVVVVVVFLAGSFAAEWGLQRWRRRIIGTRLPLRPHLRERLRRIERRLEAHRQA